jgi:ABC-type nitrate/sulfonate/bicarbonate transport system ATPase subunit
MIEVKNISKSFDSLTVLDNITLEAVSGEITSIIGPSGSGKTTLLRCITGLENHFSGEVLISGIAQKDYLTNKRIAFVTQQYSNFSWMTVKQNIEIGLGNKNNRIENSEKTINKLISILQLNGFENYYINKLSGGMKQRVAIGRALAQNTEFLAMDEPFGALDYQTRENLQLLIKTINKEYHKTILFITHDIEEAIFLSHKIILLSKLPAKIVKEYDIPIYNTEMDLLRFNESFVSLRKTIEMDLKNITSSI